MSGTTTAEVVIVGGGIEGAATAWALTCRGVCDVLVLERASVGSGGTGRSSGIVRCHYGVRSLAAMAWCGVQLFTHAAEILGVAGGVGFEPVGYLVGVGPRDAAALAANVAAAAEVGVDTRLADPEEVAQLWPEAELGDFAAFAYEPRGGYGDAYRTCHAYLAAARRGGVRVRQGAAVTRIVTAGDRAVGVELADGGQVAAGTVVLAAGVWSAALAAGVGVELPVRAQREQILLVSPGAPIIGRPVLSDLVSLQYVRPERSGELLVGNSDHSRPQWVDPDAFRQSADPEYTELAVGRFAHRFPGLPDVALSSSYAGCYDVTPDYNPIISTTSVDGLVVAAGFSGHGFKISVAVGELVADLVVDGESSHPLIPAADFRLSRFAENDPLVSPHPYVGAGQMR
ncbi:Glycine/D-amino acid oxidase, deaminating [Frankia canadensis]|uniref:Glycine/D-amino acid oxidase, deaminating n=1 Tax=Frankia canadensis TaxID=1836972 RepID=A0A2I2KVI3_9ACTN|nr:FAD-binding oxidoreductase [Frankia canadensis]SNQ49671.1 Glycine/D-amino acid oxidase, deaminating [Frankia canadensis]SOU56961.1 Glycine/D-amino acid oxidase, deaminating [Frankia canadensis]